MTSYMLIRCPNPKFKNEKLSVKIAYSYEKFRNLSIINDSVYGM